MIKKLNIIFLSFFFLFLATSYSQANFKERLIKKYQIIDTLNFNFTQKIGSKKEEYGNCYIKYPLFMRCDYPKTKKSIIVNGKKFAIVKRRYKKIYHYPLKKTPLFYLLKKESIIKLIKNYDPLNINNNTIEYKVVENDTTKLSIFFEKNTLDLTGWKTTDMYSNEVLFLIKNLKTNILIKKDFFKIPKEEDL